MLTPTDDQRAGLLVVVSGPSAAGKTTIAREIARRRDRAVHIDGDVLQGLVVSGSVTMEEPPPAGAVDQLRLRFQAALTVANLYRQSGFDAIISDNFFAEEAQRFLTSALHAHPAQAVHFVMLNPSLDAIRRRYNQRRGGGYTDTLTPEVLKTAVEATARVGLWLDSTDQNVDQTAAEILRRLHEAELVPADLSAHETVVSRPTDS